LLRKAYDFGINFFDTARYYSDSEEKIGKALSDVRQNIIIATKSAANNKKDLLADLSISLSKLKTDYIDIFQLHNPEQLPDPSDPQSSYAGLLEAQKLGLIRFIGLTNHRIQLALEGARSGLYHTIQFPLSSLSGDLDLSLIPVCKETDCGLIGMKALAGGLITNVKTAFTFLRQYEYVLPIWGIQKEVELDEFLYLEANVPQMDSELLNQISKDRQELAGKFCRGCGYCMPCPQGIQISWVARMSLLLRRAPSRNFFDKDWQEKMRATKACTQCGLCKTKCPYGLDTPKLIEGNFNDWEQFFVEKG
jgi:predicted aldo/keto reductase-like oxidoreductase